MRAGVVLDLNAVIVAVTSEEPRILVVRPPAAAASALPSGPLDPAAHRTLERGLRAWVSQQADFAVGHVEQLYTFGDRDRGERDGGDPMPVAEGRQVSVAYLALVREAALSGSNAAWRAAYEFLPWEDWRGGRPTLLDDEIVPRLGRWATADPARRDARAERIDIAFGEGGSRWDPERVLERYELLYEGGLVEESLRDGDGVGGGARTRRPAADFATVGIALALDHRRMLATALGRLRGKLRYRPVVFELLPPQFTLLHLQRVVEALAGVRLHKQNFRRLVEKGRLVEGTGRVDAKTGGRPAELFRFRREVLRERPAPGVGLPGLRRPHPAAE